ncbi:MAG TPA: hypothetical protein VF911_20785 [Thermoanaerobaculia bacterium]|jgi:hypothetical protein
MPGATGALYEPLIERDLDAIPAAVRAFLETHAEEELWIAVARFAVLAYAPSQHAKRAVMAVRAAWELVQNADASEAVLVERRALSPPTPHDDNPALVLPRVSPSVAWLIECARYASASRMPWSEPPILDPPPPDASSSLQDVIASGDRLRGERWLSAHLEDGEAALRDVARGEALLLLDAALALERRLGSKGRYALLRMVIAELLAGPAETTESLDTLVSRAIASNGAIDDVSAVFVAASGLPPMRDARPLAPYDLARDYAQTLLAHAVARTLPSRADEFLDAVHHNLEHGESFAEWSFA